MILVVSFQLELWAVYYPGRVVACVTYRGHVLERPHVVQPIGQLDEDHAVVVRH
jgi:hypothetical protein